MGRAEQADGADGANEKDQAIRALEGVLTLLEWQRVLIEDTLQQLCGGGMTAGQAAKNLADESASREQDGPGTADILSGGAGPRKTDPGDRP